MVKNLAQESKPTTIKLADGNEYELTPLDLNMMIEIEEKFDKPFAKLFEEGRTVSMRYLLYIILKQKYPDMTEEGVGKLVTAKVLAEVNKTIIEQLSG